MQLFLQLLRENEGATAVEYAVMLAMIIMACVGAIGLIGGETSGSWNNSAGKLQTTLNP